MRHETTRVLLTIGGSLITGFLALAILLSLTSCQLADVNRAIDAVTHSAQTVETAAHNVAAQSDALKAQAAANADSSGRVSPAGLASLILGGLGTLFGTYATTKSHAADTKSTVATATATKAQSDVDSLYDAHPVAVVPAAKIIA